MKMCSKVFKIDNIVNGKMGDRVKFLLLSVLFLGTVSVFAGNVFVSEGGISAEFSSSSGNVGLSKNMSYVGIDGNNYTIVVEDGLIVEEFLVNGSGSSSSSSFPSSGLVSYYSFDVGAGDDYGLNDGSANGASLTTGDGGKLDESYDFESSSNNYVNISDSSSLDITSDISLAMWFNMETLQNQGLLMKSNAGSSTQGVYTMAMDTNSGSTLYFRINGNSCNYGGAGISVGNWYYFVGTYDGSVMRMYLDGASVLNCSYSSSINTNNEALTIGQYYNNDYDFDGKIDEIGIWNRTLTASEVFDLYNSGDGLVYG